MAKQRSSGKPKWQKKTVSERIERLMSQAKKIFPDHPERSRRYIEMAKKLAMRYNVRLSPEQKSMFCKECLTLRTTETSTVRTSPTQKSVITTCKHCGNVSRKPYRKGNSK